MARSQTSDLNFCVILTNFFGGPYRSAGDASKITRKVEGRESQKRGKKELRGDQATNSGGNVIVDENESSQTRFLKFRKGIG